MRCVAFFQIYYLQYFFFQKSESYRFIILLSCLMFKMYFIDFSEHGYMLHALLWSVFHHRDRMTLSVCVLELD